MSYRTTTPRPKVTTEWGLQAENGYIEAQLAEADAERPLNCLCLWKGRERIVTAVNCRSHANQGISVNIASQPKADL